MTDGLRSYAVFTYHCGLMDWNGRAVIGFNANNSLYQNHRLAGTSDANDIACLNSPDTVWSNVVYLLFVRGVCDIDRLCMIITIAYHNSLSLQNFEAR